VLFFSLLFDQGVVFVGAMRSSMVVFDPTTQSLLLLLVVVPTYLSFFWQKKSAVDSKISLDWIVLKLLVAAFVIV